jgi:thrombospondin type-1 domain-containing protein 4
LPLSLASDESTEVDYVSSAEDSLTGNYKLKAANANNGNNSTSTIGANNNNRKKRKYTWKLIGFTPCSKSCGGGTQQPIIRCVRGEPIRAFSPKKCAHMKKPVVNENLMKCNSQPCPAFWRLGEWSGCKCGEFDEKTNQTREVKCVQELISGVVIQVNSGACIDDRPSSVMTCNCEKPLKVSKHNRLHQPISIVNNQQQNDQKINSKNRTKSPKNKKAGSWLTSEW